MYSNLKMPRFSASLSAGSGMLFALSLQLILTAFCFLFGGRLSLPAVVISWLAGLAWCVLTSRAKGAALFIGVLVCCVGFSMFLFDSAFDSVHYHKGFVRELAQGWNPIFDTDDSPNRIWWIYHYCKFAELSGAGIYMITGVFETAAAISAIFNVAMAFILYGLLRRFFGDDISRRGAVVSVLVLMANPVVMSQLFSFMNDSYVYSGICVMTVAFAIILRTENTMLRQLCIAIIACLTIVLTNVKFSHGFYAGVVWLGAGIVMLWQKRWRMFGRALVFGLSLFAIAILIVGYQPYITNLLRQGNMFYPLLGSDFDFIGSNTDAIVRDYSRPMKFVVAHLSYSKPWSVLTDPFSPQLWLAGRGPLLLGFGPLYLPLLIVSLGVLLLHKAWRSLLWLALCSLAMSFVFEVSSVARYCPFAWAPLGLAVLATYITGRQRVLAVAIASIALFTGSISFLRNTLLSLCNRERISLIAEAASQGDERVLLNNRCSKELLLTLSEDGVSYKIVDSNLMNPARTIKIYGKNTTHDHAPLIELPPHAYSRLRSMGKLQKAAFNIAGDETR